MKSWKSTNSSRPPAHQFFTVNFAKNSRQIRVWANGETTHVRGTVVRFTRSTLLMRCTWRAHERVSEHVICTLNYKIHFTCIKHRPKKALLLLYQSNNGNFLGGPRGEDHGHSKHTQLSLREWISFLWADMPTSQSLLWMWGCVDIFPIGNGRSLRHVLSLICYFVDWTRLM